MLRFILIVMIMVVLLRIGQDDPYTAFGLYLLMSVSFVYYANNYVDTEVKDGRLNVAKLEANRIAYYRKINSK